MELFDLKSLYYYAWIFFIGVSINNTQAQNRFFEDQARQYVNLSAESWGLTSTDIEGMLIVDGYTSEETGITYLYLQQTYNGIPISNALSTILIDKAGNIRSSTHRYIPKITQKVLTPKGQLKEAKEAILLVSQSLGISINDQLKLLRSRESGVLRFQSRKIEKDITVSKIYDVDKEGMLRLCWKIILDDPESADMWQIHADALSGEIINKYNYTVYCSHSPGKFNHQEVNCNLDPDPLNYNLNKVPGASYLVYKLPAESPNHSARELATDREYFPVSPWGWHDDNGDGIGYTITRGNNVHAYEDSNDNNSSQNNEPDGGMGLSFIFEHDLENDPTESMDASITNLFYTNNMAHDLFYLLGFTEEAGNFQKSNMGKGGIDGDFVRAEGIDGESIGNANFSTPSDGGNGRMQMYLFNIAPSILKIEDPFRLNNLNFEIGRADFGQNIFTVDLEGEIFPLETNNNIPETLGCATITDDLSGKIAMIDRGVCDFSLKVFNAQQAGVMMAIVCNVSGVNGGSGEELLEMAKGDNADLVTIPSAFMKKSDCDLIKATIENGETVIMSARRRQVVGPSLLDADFDNGVILHEYAHGVSLRLTGGPSNTSCLPDFDDDNDRNPDRGEQMGEGWSDFFALAFTTRPEDQGFESRGIGTYVENENPDENGIRSFPYSTDLDINPLTYDDIKTQSVPHGVGTVWAAILWDMYWKFIEIYGFDPDWSNIVSGNYRACFLIMEAMKIQPCRPGFVDGRNSILEADNIFNDGEHQKLIWESFARRGVGMHADQGSSVDQRDGTEDFAVPPLLIEELKIEKTVSRFVEPGENILVSVKITNHIPSTQHGIIVTDEMPQGLVYDKGSSSITPEIQENILTFEVGSLNYKEEFLLVYELTTDPGVASTTLYLDDIENGVNGWTLDSRKGTNPWNIVNDNALSGEFSWFISETDSEEVDQRLVSPMLSVSGDNPVLRFWHQFNIVSGANGGFIELSSDGGNNWVEVDDKFIIRNEYPGQLAFSTFAIPSLEGFSGSTKGQWVDSYIDLSAYKGMNIIVRFRFGNEGVLVSDGNHPGWFIDEVELVDLQVYSSNACVFSTEDPITRCTAVQHSVVNSDSTTSTDDSEEYSSRFSIFPNPSRHKLYIRFEENNSVGRLVLKSLDGKTVAAMILDGGKNLFELDVNGINSGLYILSITENGNIFSQKVQIIH